MEHTNVNDIEALIESRIHAQRQLTEESFVPFLVHHKDFKVTDLEQYQEQPCRYINDWSTYDIASFIAYVNQHSVPELTPTVFVSSKNMLAEATLDYGNVSQPQFRNNKVSLSLEMTPEFKALVRKVGDCSVMTQRDTLEWLETWSDIIHYYDVNGDRVETNDAERWIKSLTIETAKKSTVEIDQFSEQMSDMEKIEAKSNSGKMISYLVFNCEPYYGLKLRHIDVKVRIITSSDTPKIRFHAPKLEILERDMSEEFKDIVLGKLREKIRAYIVK